jgi:hypothetical protein
MTRDNGFPLSIMDGQRCIGFVLSRGPRGYEAVVGPSGEISLGTFTDRDAAIAAVMNSIAGSS